MTVGYYTGTSTGPNDLLSKLRTALATEGWSENGYAAIGAGYRLHVFKDVDSGTDMYFNFRSAIAEYGTTLITPDNSGATNGTVTGLVINGSTGYNAGSLWHSQPGYPQSKDRSNYGFGNVMSPMSTTAIPAYYFFFVGNSVHIVVEITAGKFQFMSFGMLEKQGAFTGGQYFTASLSSYYPSWEYTTSTTAVPNYFTSNYRGSSGFQHGAVYVDVDSAANWRIAGDGYSAITYAEIVFPCTCSMGTDGKAGFNQIFYWKSPSSYNSMAAMCPIYTFLKRSDNNYSLLGWPEGVRFLNCTNYSAGEEVTYGDETWKIFHADSVSATPTNPYCGFAFLKDDGT